jgi:hypothetical protein
MNDICVEMRQRIEDSLSYTLEPRERDELERHCAQCEACRAYREQLLADDARLAAYVAPCGESIRRVRSGAIEKVRAAALAESRGLTTESSAPRGSRPGGTRARIPRIAAIAGAAAAVIIALLVIDLIRGARNGPVPAFAAVQDKMQKCESVTFRLRLWEAGKWTTREDGRASSGIYRKDYGDSITIHGHGAKNSLEIVETNLYPGERRATVFRMTFPPYTAADSNHKYAPHDPVDLLASWYKMKGFAFVRTERLRGKNTAVYEKLHPPKPRETWRMTAWVDLETELPVRFEMVAQRSGPNDDVYPVHLRLSDFVSDSSRAVDWIYLKPDEPITVFDDFRWNAVPDPSYFSFTPPAGYRVESYRAALDSCLTEGESRARYFSVILSRWLAQSGNVFPDDLADLDNDANLKQLILAKYRRGGDSAEEFRAACEAAYKMHQGSLYLAMRSWTVNPRGAEKRVAVHYDGKGATFGDAKRIVCWLKDENKPPCPGRSGNGPYFLIYADLHIAASATPPEPAAR